MRSRVQDSKDVCVITNKKKLNGVNIISFNSLYYQSVPPPTLFFSFPLPREREIREIICDICRELCFKFLSGSCYW